MGTIYPQMKRQTKFVRDGNSWSVRIPKQALIDSGLKPDTEIVLRADAGKITIYSSEAAKQAGQKDKYDLAKQDVQKALDEAFEQAWLELFGLEEY